MPISIEYVFPILAVPINTNIYSNTCCSGTRTRLLKAASPSSSRRNVLKEAQNINKSYRLLVKIAQNCSKMRKFAQICARFVENGETKLKSACFAGPTNQHLFQYLLFMFSIPQYQYLLRLNSILIGILNVPRPLLCASAPQNGNGQHSQQIHGLRSPTGAQKYALHI